MSDDNYINMLVISTSLCEKFDVWSKDEQIMNVLNMEKNNLCISLREKFHDISDKVIQSIVFSMMITLYMTMYNTTDDNNIDDINDVVDVDVD